MLTVSAKQKRQENKSKGIFHTNQKLAIHIKNRMIEYANKLKCGEITEIVDLCCGVGGLLKVFDDNVEKYGCDIEEAFVLEAEKNINGHFICDSIFNNPFKDKKFKFIIGNYPFSINGDGKEITRLLEAPVELSNKLDNAFIYANLKALSDDGLCLLLSSNGVLFRDKKEQMFRKYLIDNNYLEAIEEIPSDKEFFDDTIIPVVLLVFRKNKSTDSITIIDKNGEKKEVSKKEIEDNNYNLNISRYIYHEIVEEEVDVLKCTRDIIEQNIDSFISNIDMLSSIEELYNENFIDKYIDSIYCICEEFKKDKQKALKDIKDRRRK